MIYNGIGLIEYWAILSNEHELANQLSYDDITKDFAKKKIKMQDNNLKRIYIYVYIA